MKRKLVIMYSRDRRNLISSEEFQDLGYPGGYECAAITEIYNDNGKLISCSTFISTSAWVDADEENATEKAMALTVLR